MNANLLFTWLRDPRFAPTEDGPKLLPVDVAADGGVDDASPAAPPSSGRIEIELPNGVRLRCDAEALARVLDVIGLSA